MLIYDSCPENFMYPVAMTDHSVMVENYGYRAKVPNEKSLDNITNSHVPTGSFHL
jgi:hypothetical protein